MNIALEIGTCLMLFLMLWFAYDSTGKLWLEVHEEAAMRSSKLMGPRSSQLTGDDVTDRTPLQQNFMESTWRNTFNRFFCCFCARKPKDVSPNKANLS